MRALAVAEYGGPETYAIAEVPDPSTGPDRIVVKVAAASINPVDYKILAGALDGAFPTIWPLVPGWDVAGEVIAVGPAVRALRPELVPGAAVIGYARMDFVGAGTWAQMVSMPMRGLALAPKNLDASHASCLPLAGLTAYQLLTEAVEVQPGERVLIHAASGGVGHLAVQIARSLGATVIGSASAKNQDFVRSLGADAVEYGDGLPTQVRSLAPDGVDAVLDLVGGLAIEQTPGLLRPGGRWATITDAERAGELGGTYVFVRPDPTQLAELARLADRGDLVPRVHATYDLDAVGDAVNESMRSIPGKVVLAIG